MNSLDFEERYTRQRDIVPPDRLAACNVTVVGVGAIGRQVALQLAAMGAPCLQLIDYDVIEPSNLASQGYLQDDMGRFKVEATADLARQLNHELEVRIVKDRFRRSQEIGNVLFSCVDSIEVRRFIWNTVKDNVEFFCGARMTTEVLRVLSVSDNKSYDYYPSTLFSAGEAYVGPCTAKTTIYCANIAAGLVVTQFTKYLRRMPIDPDIHLNLLSSEMSISDTNI